MKLLLALLLLTSNAWAAKPCDEAFHSHQEIFEQWLTANEKLIEADGENDISPGMVQHLQSELDRLAKRLESESRMSIEEFAEKIPEAPVVKKPIKDKNLFLIPVGMSFEDFDDDSSLMYQAASKREEFDLEAIEPRAEPDWSEFKLLDTKRNQTKEGNVNGLFGMKDGYLHFWDHSSYYKFDRSIVGAKPVSIRPFLNNMTMVEFKTGLHLWEPLSGKIIDLPIPRAELDLSPSPAPQPTPSFSSQQAGSASSLHQQMQQQQQAQQMQQQQQAQQQAQQAHQQAVQQAISSGRSSGATNAILSRIGKFVFHNPISTLQGPSPTPTSKLGNSLNFVVASHFDSAGKLIVLLDDGILHSFEILSKAVLPTVVDQMSLSKFPVKDMRSVKGSLYFKTEDQFIQKDLGGQTSLLSNEYDFISRFLDVGAYFLKGPVLELQDLKRKSLRKRIPISLEDQPTLRMHDSEEFLYGPMATNPRKIIIIPLSLDSERDVLN